jgi:hypothetical protein
VQPLSKIANEGDIAVFPSWYDWRPASLPHSVLMVIDPHWRARTQCRSLSTFCAPFGIRFAHRQPSYRVHSRVVRILSDPFSGPPASPATGDGTLGGCGVVEAESQSIEGNRESRAMSDPTAAATLRTSKLAIRTSKGKEKAAEKSSSVIVLNKESKRALIKKHKKAAILLEYDSYVPPPDLVRCMKKVIAMMEKEGNKSVGRWYKKKQGTHHSATPRGLSSFVFLADAHRCDPPPSPGRIIEACPWNRYYPSSSDSDGTGSGVDG